MAGTRRAGTRLRPMEDKGHWGAHPARRGRRCRTSRRTLPPFRRRRHAGIRPSRRPGFRRTLVWTTSPILLRCCCRAKWITSGTPSSRSGSTSDAATDRGADPIRRGHRPSGASLAACPIGRITPCDQVLSQVDNTFATSFYQPFAGPASSFPGLSGLIKIAASDLHENRKWVGLAAARRQPPRTPHSS